MKRTATFATLLTIAVLINAGAEPPAVESETIVHLLNRAGYGPRPGDVEKVRQKGFAAYVEEQLHPETISDGPTEARLASLDTLGLTAPDLRRRYSRDPRPVIEQLQSQKIIRALYSERQLQEVLVDFWFNHFNVNAGKQGVQYVITGYERDAIRPHALGKFRDLLRATARHPAMLVYLDNALSTAAGINENYARELMELHTMGVDGGYLQKDIEEVARALTGWTVDATGDFQFRADLHAPGSKVLLEHEIPFGGYEEGEAVLDIVAGHPATAHFIATKLVRRFVADDPPETLVDRVAAVFKDTDGDIRSMVRTILTSDEFGAMSAVRSKTKSPFEAIVSAMRAVDADLADSVDDLTLQGNLRGLATGDVVLTKTGRTLLRLSPAIVITRLIQEMGQFPYQKAEPTGYPDRSDYWTGGWNVLHRMNFAVSLTNNQILGTTVAPARFAAAFENDPSAQGAEAWRTALREVNNPPARRLSGNHAGNTAAAAEAFALALGSPEFQQK